ncbi:STAS domain-containing protein [Paenibacillus koleovorans]|uniref:STAS domain-containing protein n=1 Tax=Paenibacillus koleovorans TaxID=121608 RepID=UPI000FDB789B|nr:STAS domain-containing protein [Paenibacillus koleovorans]
MEIGVSKQPNCTIISLNGRLDGTTFNQVETALLEQIAHGELKLVLDCSQLSYISSAGLRVLLVAAKKMKAAKGSMSLSGLNENVKEVFEVSGFSSIFTIYATSEEAADKFA